MVINMIEYYTLVHAFQMFTSYQLCLIKTLQSCNRFSRVWVLAQHKICYLCAHSLAIDAVKIALLSQPARLLRRSPLSSSPHYSPPRTRPSFPPLGPLPDRHSQRSQLGARAYRLCGASRRRTPRRKARCTRRISSRRCWRIRARNQGRWRAARAASNSRVCTAISRRRRWINIWRLSNRRWSTFRVHAAVAAPSFAAVEPFMHVPCGRAAHSPQPSAHTTLFPATCCCPLSWCL